MKYLVSKESGITVSRFSRTLTSSRERTVSGKTTLLKLLWYCLSGNVDRIGAEMTLHQAHLETSSFKLNMSKEAETEMLFELEIGGLKVPLEQEANIVRSLLAPYPIPQPSAAQEVKRHILNLEDSSIFFPTFRRIEGGFTMEQRRRRLGRSQQVTPLQEALSDLSDSLDVGNHHFVASISTDDIVNLLTAKFAESSRRTNRLHVHLADFITKLIHEYELERKTSDQKKLANAETTLSKIQTKTSEIEAHRSKLLKPFEVLAELVGRIFEHRGIKVTEAISFGTAAEAIASEKLSAGEKQMLSFLCYNAFNSGACIFIDEPEISLHVDWQRTLFPTLLEQSTANQFIIATHSPFIYSKYADKELALNPDKGED